MIAIIDYGMGNVRSVYNVLEYIGEDVIITADSKQIDNASHLILPGVGAFGDAMRNLEERGLVEILNKQVIDKGKPFLGICLGLQLIAERGYEHGIHKGLAWIDAEVARFEIDEKGLKVPHMGWNDIIIKQEHPIFHNLKKHEMNFYFVHSYHIKCKDDINITATCDYGYEFTAVVHKDNIVATQFHPEKSQENGIQMIENFISWRM